MLNARISTIPPNHNVTGTCGKCGGPVIAPIMWGGTLTGNGPATPPESCMDCGAIPKPFITPIHGPIREMN